jgi:hypothetical protein
MQTAIVDGRPTDLLFIPTTQQPGSSVNTQYISQHYVSDTHYMGPLLDPTILSHFQNYCLTTPGQAIVPSQSHAHLVRSQKNFPIPATQTQDGHDQYFNTPDDASPALPIVYGCPTPPTSSSTSPHACDVCGATFTRPHNRKRHYESQHSMIEHVCKYCRKSYTRVDSLKRHLDKPCDQMPQSTQNYA